MAQAVVKLFQFTPVAMQVVRSPVLSIKSHMLHTPSVCGTLSLTVLSEKRIGQNTTLTTQTLSADLLPTYLSHQQVRWYNRKKTVKVPPSKPPQFDYSGDLVKTQEPLDLSAPKLGYENIPELESASEEVKKIFSLDFADGREVVQKRLQDIIDKVRDHPADVASREKRIAALTITIRNQLEHIGRFHNDKWNKARLIERIQQRKKLLGQLRDLDYEKFEWLLEELKLEYEHPKEYNRKESKRAKRKRLAVEAMLKIKHEKLAAYRQQVEKEKAEFMVHKENELKDIEAKLKELGIDDDMTSLDKLLTKLNIPEFMPEEPDRRTMRQKRLAKKFELYTKLYKGEEARV